jgi:hypothetical protein
MIAASSALPLGEQGPVVQQREGEVPSPHPHA